MLEELRLVWECERAEVAIPSTSVRVETVWIDLEDGGGGGGGGGGAGGG